MTEHAREMLQIARRYAGLPEDKRAAFRARLIEAGIAPERLPIVPLADRPDRLALSPAQERLWFLWRLAPEDTAYVIAGAVRLTGRLDVARLRRALAGVVARHEVLRTRFVEQDGKAWQVISDAADYGWSEAADLAVRPFDLERGPLLRAALSPVGPDRHDLLLSMHHIVSDGWSIPILLREVSALYAGGDLAPLPIQYGDYALWQREWLDERRLDRQLAYWRDRLGTDHPGLRLPTRASRARGQGARVAIRVPAGLTARLRRLARAEGATLFMTLLASFAVLLQRHAGQHDIRIGVPSAGRQRVETEGLIGFFVNTLVLRAELSGGQAFADLLAQTRQRLLEAQANQDLPFERLVAALNPDRDSPLFRVMFNLQPAGAATLDLAGLVASRIDLPPNTTQTDLALGVTEFPDDLLVNLDYDAGLFDAATVDRVATDYLDLLGQLAGPTLLREFRLASVTSDPAPATYIFDGVPARFWREAAVRPLAEAVACGAERLSHGGLDVWSNRIGRRLKRLGVGSEERVGLCLERSVGLVAGLLGILKAGGAYVPLDPAYPAARLQFMIEDAGVRRIVVDASTADRFPGHEVIRIDGVEAESAAGWTEAIHPDQLAYVIYTSGSTGQPKGVAISHGSLSLHMNDFIGSYGITADDVVLQLATISFDVGTEQVLPPLLTGARVVMRGPELLEAGALNRLLIDERVSVAGFATAYWQQWLHDLPASLPSLRLVMVGGEALPGDALRRWQAGPLSAVRLDNLYGPTETTVTACLHPTGPEDADSLFVSIGRGFPGRSLVIVDGDGNPSPMGELCIGGASVGRGYLGRPGLTAERFVPDPFGTGGRLYRTGDLCRRRPDGTIEFLGRLDHQVKLRGHRIELGEVEAALRACGGVTAAAAAIKGEGENRRLVGYAVGTADAEALKSALATRLPDYLVPSVVVMLDALPLLPNGKTDAAALPEPAAAARALVLPRDDREAALLTVWRGVLKREDIGVTENFFALGGDSILSLQVVARARQAGLRLTPKQLFEEPTIAALAALAGEVAEATAAIADFAAPPAAALGLDPADVEDIYPATTLQQGLIYHGLLAAGDGVYVNQLRLTLRAPLDVAALRAAWDEALTRHAVLRTGFDWRHGGATLQVVRRRLDLPWDEQDWSGRETYESDLAAWRDADVAAGFDLAQPPLFRLALFHRPDGDADLIWTNHHALTDGWSGAQLLGEVNEGYRARRAGRPPALQAPAAYRGYVAWVRAQSSSEAWWRAQLATVVDPVGLTFGLGRPAQVEPGSHRLVRRLGDLGHRLRVAAQRRAVTLNTLIQGAWALLIARYGGRPEVAFGVTVSGRPAELPGVERMLGLFINSLPLWVGLPASRRLDDWLQDLQRHNVGLRQYEHTALGDLQRWSGRSGDALFDSLVVFENYPVDEALHRAPGGLDVAAIASWDRTHFPLTLTVVPRKTLELVWEWDGARFARPAIERLATDYLDLLDRLAGAGDVVLGEIGLSSGQRDAATAVHDFDAVPLRVSRRAWLQPEAEAVSCGEERLSHGALEAWSNRIGRRLRRLGVVAEDRVGLCIARSAGLVVGLLGIWKSGGAYVPLDPSYPVARLAEMIADAGVRRVVTDRGTAEALRDVLAGLDLVVIGEVDEDAAAQPLHYLPGQLAYVIYTSGSTGKPKGVAISHGSLSQHMDDFIGTYGISADDVVLQSSTVNFDVALHEMFPALIQGGRIVMRGPALWELDGLTQRLAEEGVTFARIPTAYWQQWLHVLPADLPALRQITVGGEGLPGDALRRWQAGPLAHVRLDNLYGPTETTVAALARRTTAGDADEVIVPIGVAYPSRSVAVIDGDGNLVPVGGLGELCIGGETVGRGYLDRPALTAERFVPDPFGTGGRLYRTGDLCRRRPDGTIEFLGRLDHQVKLRGHRIELGEVEAALRACAGVTAAAAAIKGEGENRRLVGYAVGTADAEALKSALATRLPDYLVPSVVVVLDALPLLPNGKTDAAALPEPAAAARALVLPRDDREAALLTVWRGVLKREDIGVTENFFALGGDSILSLQVVARARQAGLKLTPKQLFEEPTIAALAALAGEVVSEVVEDAAGEIPLTPIQAWFFERFPEGENHWNQSVLLSLREELDIPRLTQALSNLVRRHDALRLRFTRDHDGWHQTVAAPHPVEIEVAKAADLTDVGTRLQQRLDITNGPLIRAGYYGNRLLLAIHHLAVDGVSWRVLLEELQQAYAGAELPPVGTSWAAWAKRLDVYRGTVVNELGWWRERLSRATGLPELRAGDRRLSSSKLATWRLDEAATARLLSAAPRAYRLGVDELLLSALVQAAGHGLLVEVEGHGREDLFNDVDLSRTVGWFTTSYPVWLPDGAPVAVKEALRAVPMKGLHWGLLGVRDLPKADIGFNYLGRFDQSVERDGLFSFSRESGGRSLSGETELDHALEINGSIANGCLSLSWRYSPAVMEPARVEELLGRFEQKLQALVEHCLTAPPTPTASDYPLAGLTQEQFAALDLGEVQDIYPATGLQQGLLYHGLLKQGDGVYVNQLRLTLKGPLNVAALRGAWNEVVARHDILRTGFEWRHGGEALQVVRKSVELPWVEPDEEIAAWCAADLARGFDLSQAPLLRLALFRRPDGDYDLIRTSHHLLSDGWSSARLLAEVSECYRGRTAELPPPVPYRSYVAWTRRQPSGEAWWRGIAASVEDPVGLTASLGAPAKPEPGIHRIEQHLADLGERLRQAARRRSVTLNTLMQGAWALLLSRFGAKDAVGFGVTVSGRPAALPGVERMLGLFINSLPLWIELPASRTLDAWLQDLQRRNVELRQYEHTPLSDLQRWTGRSGDALFDSLLVFENYPVDEAVGRGEGGLRAGKVEIAERTHYPLTLTVSPSPLTLDWAWDGERLDRADIQRLTAHYAELLEELAGTEDPALGAIGLSVPEAVAEPFEYRFTPVFRRLSASATIACDGEAISGDDLAAWSRRIGGQLRRLGTEPDELVGLCVERSAGLVAAMLGVWQSGGAYVPLDPAYPAARLGDMIADAGLRRVVVDRTTAQQLAGLLDGLDLVFVDEGIDEDWSEEIHPARLAYVIYTSGSTGKPKGVGVSHGALDRLLMSMAVRPGLTADDIWLAVTSLSFDIAALELLLPLIVGGRLEIARRDSVQDGRRLAALLETTRATVLQATPLGWRLLLEGGWAGRKLKGLCGGEALPSDLAAALHARGVTLWNMYGPTETTIWSALSLTEPGRPITLGGPIHDTVLRLVDPAGQVVPAGGIGELCIGGANLARGYLGRAGLTAERFVPDPLGQGARLYRTGDLCRQRGDGRLEFLGRLDNQVKLRGHRIELGEVEAQLGTCPGVRAAAAAIRGSQLVGYVVGQADGGQVKALLAARLPDYLVPSAVLVLDALPQTPNGKLDRRALPEPAAAARQVVGPRNAIEAALRDIWGQVLRRDDISVTDSFFDLGGDLLGALRMAGRIRQTLDRDLPLQALFAHPKLADLAALLSDQPVFVGGAIRPRPAGMMRLPLSLAQERLWFLWRLSPDDTAYVLAGAVRLTGRLDIARLREALAGVVARHEALRTRFVEEDGAAWQVVSSEPVYDWSEDPTIRPFNLARGPLLRAALATLGPDEYTLTLSMHHIVSDGWSIPILLREVSAFYAGAALAPLPIQYGDYALWQRARLTEERQAEQIEYWRDRLGTEHPELPLPAKSGPLTGRGGRLTATVPAGLTARLRQMAREQGATLFMTMLAGFALLLHRYSGQHDLRIGVPSAGRQRVETEGLIGFFVNTLVLRAEISASQTVADLVAQLRDRLGEAQGHQDLPFDRLAAALNPARITPLFRVMFNLQQAEPGLFRLPGLVVSGIDLPSGAAQIDLALNVTELPDDLALGFDYAADLFDADTIARLADDYIDLLGRLAPAMPSASLGLASGVYDPFTASHGFDAVPLRVSRRAWLQPEAEAVSCGEERLSHGALEAWSNRIGRRLRRLGVVAEDRVGLCIARSAGLVAGLLGIWKSGGAYVPLDPSYPVARLAEMIADAGVRRVVTDRGTAEALRDLLAGLDLVVIGEVDEDAAALPLHYLPGQMAYVIYTSGSTGKPKGVAISHGSLSQHMDDFIGTYGISADDVVLQSSTVNFDVALHEMFPALIQGGRIVMRGPALWELDGLTQRLAEEGVTFARIPTAYWQQWLHVLPADLPALRQITVGGEGLPGDALRRWQAGPLAHVRLDNLYGPTETTVAALARRTTAGDADEVIVPIGVAYPSRSVAVIDGDGNLVPVGGLGELCIGGETVGRGYLDRPGLTAERFVPDPFGTGGRLYRTGDLCRRRPDGTIEFLGRLDHQVKLRGHRIELGEVEAALRACAGVTAAAAAIKGEGENRRLVGYAVGAVEAAALKTALAARLPDYLVPSVVVVLDALPLLPNGKTDAAALPEPVADERELVLPRDDREAALLSVWRGVLKREDIGVTENFFALGGDSILSLQVVARARQAGLKLTPKQLFEEPTIAALAALAGEVKADIAEDVAGDIPLTPIQSWFFERFPEGENHWNQSVLLDVREELDLERLARALNQLVVRHDALRLRFTRDHDGWHQTVAAPHPVEIELATPDDLTEAGTQLQQRLDITNGPLIRAGYYGNRLLLAIHHLAVDGVSWRVLLEELQQAYAGAELPPVGTSWAAWAKRLDVYRGTVVNELGWWRDRLVQATGLPTLTPGDRRLSSSKLVTWRLDEAATARLLSAAPRAYRLGVDELLLSALVQAAGHGLLVEVEGHGREDLFNDVDLSRTVGWFTTSYPVWLPDGAPVAVKEALRAVPMKGLHWGLLPHDGLPKADIGFNYLGRFDQSVERDGLFSFSRESGGRSLSGETELDHALEINGSIANGCLSLSWRYSPAVMEPARVEELLGRFEQKLQALVEHCLTAPPTPTASDYPLAGLTQEQFAALDLGEVQDIYPATGLQQGLLYHGLLKQGDGVYVNQLRLTLKGPLDVAALRGAWNEVVARHDILRTGFEWRHGGEALQVVRKSVELPWVEPDEEIAAWCAADLARGFDLSQAPLLRLALFRRPDGDYDLIRTSHHLLSDGWSSARLLAEVSECYRGRTAELPPPVPYRSYVAWTRRQPSGEAWWRGIAASVEDPVGLTASLGAPAKPEPGIHRIEQHLADLGERLRQAARRRSVTLNTLMQGAWALLLSRFGAKDAVGFGVTVSGRPAALPGVERMLGLFINSLPLWIELPASRTLDAWLQDLQRRNVELRQYEHTPLSDLQRWTGRSGDALFDSLLVFENYPVDEAVGRGEGGLRAGKVEIAERTHYPLTLTVSPSPLTLDWAWDGERLDRADIQRLTAHYAELLEELAGTEDPALGAIGLSVPEAVAEPFEYRFTPVFRRLSASATIACDGEAISGDDLAAWSRRIGGQLRRLGTEPDELVGLCVERSAGLVAAMLGVWQSGGAYVPLDPAYPAARLGDMIADAGLRRVVVDRTTAQQLAGLLDGLDLVFVDEGIDEDWSEEIHPARLAYVIYTSGSTGKPKGVGVSHGALDRLLMSMAVRPGLTADDIWLAVTSLSFDIAALELLLPLIVGGRLEIARRDSVQDGRRLAALLETTRATVLQATPLGWRLLLEGGWAGRKLKGLCGGEALPSDLAAALHARGVTLWNMYGPTETTIWSALSLTEPGRPITLGGPIHDTVLRLVDPAGQVVPAGGIGELCIGGANLARGYLGRAGLTAERFVPDPLGQGARLYRTGDLCRQRGDGRLEFLGRLDNQVKLRGHRIELGEVEAQLGTCPGVRAAAAAIRGSQLVGYVVGQADGGQVKALLAARLPDYLVPSAVLVLDALPQTPNGKLDRRALPEPATAARQVVGPRNATEAALRDIWGEVLRRDDISVTDSFFDLGGDSLGALRVAALATRRGLGRLTPATVFARPVLAALASYLQVEAAGLPANILPMNSVGMARTLFCLHPGYGLVGDYRALADALEGQVTVYGMQSPIHAEPDWRVADFDALAADYVGRIRQVQPAGPYHLLGWSHGGLVAAAMARRLEEEGEELGLVGLIDTVAHIDRNVIQPDEAGDDQAEIAALVAGIRGGGWQDHVFDAQENEALRRTVAVVRHHHALVQGYALPRLKSDLSLWWAGQAGPRTEAELDWQVHTSGRVRVVATLDTGHAAIIRDSRLIAAVAQLMRESQRENISPAS